MKNTTELELLKDIQARLAVIIKALNIRGSLFSDVDAFRTERIIEEAKEVLKESQRDHSP